ncbi:MAG: nucleotide exchange factor GrpE [Kofleriaceae bacterium]
MSDSDPPFDAVAAAKELDDLLGEPGVTVASDDQITKLEQEIDELNELVAAKELLVKQADQRARQAHAEIDAAAKRLAGASAKELERRTRQILEGFLPVIDDLDRGIAAARKSVESADVVEGLELIRRSVLAQLGGFGVKHAPALGEVFDPHRHEAIALVPVSDRRQDGRVIDVMREGYQIGDVTLRPAGVAVGKA